MSENETNNEQQTPPPTELELFEEEQRRIKDEISQKTKAHLERIGVKFDGDNIVTDEYTPDLGNLNDEMEYPEDTSPADVARIESERAYQKRTILNHKTTVLNAVTSFVANNPNYAPHREKITSIVLQTDPIEFAKNPMGFVQHAAGLIRGVIADEEIASARLDAIQKTKEKVTPPPGLQTGGIGNISSKPKDDNELSEQEKRVCREMGISEESYIKSAARLAKIERDENI